MKYLILVRHGEYDRAYHLSSNGREQVVALAEKLKSFVNGSSVIIFTSIADRARESADILCSFFGVDYEKHEILWSENDHPANFLGTLNLVRSNKDRADILILVTHIEYVEDFPSYFTENELGTKLRSTSVGKGEALVIDCQQKTLTHVC